MGAPISRAHLPAPGELISFILWIGRHINLNAETLMMTLMMTALMRGRAHEGVYLFGRLFSFPCSVFSLLVVRYQNCDGDDVANVDCD